MIELLVVVVILEFFRSRTSTSRRERRCRRKSLTSVRQWDGEECANWIRFQPAGSSAPAYISNDLVNVNTHALPLEESLRQQNLKNQAMGCINDPNPRALQTTHAQSQWITPEILPAHGANPQHKDNALTSKKDAQTRDLCIQSNYE